MTRLLRTVALLFCIALFAQSGEPPIGVDVQPNAKPFEWPKVLTALPFGERVRYRTSLFSLEAVLRKDGDAEVVVYRGDKEVARQFFGLPGQFSILDVDGPLPVIECWGDRFDSLATRWLQRVIDHPARGIEMTSDFIEIYTPDRTQTKHAVPHVVTRRPSHQPKTFYFYGFHQGFSPEKAKEALTKAQTGKP